MSGLIIVVAVLLGLWLLKLLVKFGVLGAVKLATNKLAAAGVCEMCWKKPRVYVCNLNDEVPPFNACEDCIESKASGHFREHLIKTGRLRRIEGA
jgi:hypothetical protein